MKMLTVANENVPSGHLGLTVLWIVLIFFLFICSIFSIMSMY
jgi:hypothetical protein